MCGEELAENMGMIDAYRYCLASWMPWNGSALTWIMPGARFIVTLRFGRSAAERGAREWHSSARAAMAADDKNLRRGIAATIVTSGEAWSLSVP